MRYSKAVGKNASYSTDIVHDVMLGISHMAASKIDRLIDQDCLTKYIYRAIFLQHTSAKSDSTARRYRFNNVVICREDIASLGKQDEETPDLINSIEDWFEREILRLKLEGYTTQEIHEMTGITRVNIDRTFESIKRKLKENASQ